MPKRIKPSHVRLGVGVVVCAGLAVQCRQTHSAEGIRTAPRPAVAVEKTNPATLVSDGRSESQRLAQSDPLAFLKHCLAEYDRKVKDYEVTFTKQERLKGKLAPEQVTEVRFREAPYSVDMVWTHNPNRAARVLYVEGARRDKQGRGLALVKPAGILGGIGIKVERDIHGPDAEVESRRTIDQFGFRKTLNLIVHYCDKAKAEGALDLEYTGEGSLDGRPTFIFERRLPYTGEEALYPDRLLVFHIDQEWLLPTGCFSYADDAGTELLGKYLLTDASFNLGYSAADFDPDHLSF